MSRLWFECEAFCREVSMLDQQMIAFADMLQKSIEAHNV